MTRIDIQLGDARWSGDEVGDVTLLWTDPPFATGKRRKGAAGSYMDEANTRKTVEAIRSWLPYIHPEATVAVCCDFRLAPDVVAGLPWVYRGEIVWQFGLGRPRTSWWPVRHNNILTFTRTKDSGRFDPTAVPRQQRLAPKAGYPADRPSGSVWDFTMSNTHPDRTGYPNQKPIEIIKPFVLAHTLEGETVLDPYCGSGSTGAAALACGRGFFGVDNNPEAIEVAQRRLHSDPDCAEEALEQTVVIERPTPSSIKGDVL